MERRRRRNLLILIIPPNEESHHLEHADRIQSLTRQDVQEVAQHYFNRDAVVSVVTPR